MIGLSDPLKALVEFYTGFNARDVDKCMQNWANRNDVIMCNPIGGIRIGSEEITQAYQRIMQGDTQVYVEFYDYHLFECTDVFYAVGRERGYAKNDNRLNQKQIDLSIRTSRIFQRINGTWQQVHHHGSMDDPELLNQYQAFLLKGDRQ